MWLDLNNVGQWSDAKIDRWLMRALWTEAGIVVVLVVAFVVIEEVWR